MTVQVVICVFMDIVSSMFAPTVSIVHLEVDVSMENVNLMCSRNVAMTWIALDMTLVIKEFVFISI